LIHFGLGKPLNITSLYKNAIGGNEQYRARKKMGAGGWFPYQYFDRQVKIVIKGFPKI